MFDFSTLSHIPEHFNEISFYFSWDKDFIVLAERSIPIMALFFLFLEENTCCGHSLEVSHQPIKPTHNIFPLRPKKHIANFWVSKSWLDKLIWRFH